MNQTPPKNTAYWSEPAEQVLVALNSRSSGLTVQEAEERLKRAGFNRLDSKKSDTAFALFLNQFKSPIVLILLGATIVSAVVSDWADALVILLIVLGSTLLSFSQEYNAGNAVKKLQERVKLKSNVLRAGKVVSSPSEEIVPGDVVFLSAGSLIPADGLVLEANEFFVNQAVLTGETFPVEKKPGVVPANASLSQRSNMVFMGTNVHSGSASVVMLETGAKTAFGQIAASLTLRPPETEFERSIKRLGSLLAEVMFVLVIIIFALNIFLHKPLLDSLLFSIALAVGLTPQLLPAIININLAKGSQVMARHGVIVRRLEAIENFGSMDILCTDKTGTLTMGVVQLDQALDAGGRPADNVLLYATLNAAFQAGMPNPLDEAILQRQAGGANAYTKVDEIPYDFVRKRLSVVVSDAAGGHWLITKGALENILAVCSHVELDGKQVSLDSDAPDGICDKFEEWSAQGYRVLGLAAKRLTDLKENYAKADEAGLTFYGFLLFLDPPKPGVQQVVAGLHQLGVNLKIITGDNRLVARHIGEALGFENLQVLAADELNNLRDEALWHAVEKTTIFAEVDPNQKERIILALKKRGHVVGYMGDGINDASSLHSADVGISVENAVDVAKEAADLVLLRQDLEILHEGILQGRKTFANTLKYIFMAASANFGNMFSMAGASLFLPFLPMLPMQILLINFLTDLPEMAIASDNVDQEFLQRPQRMDVRFIRRFMLVFGSLSSMFDYLTFGVLILLARSAQSSFHTGWFVESVLSAGFVVFAVRTRLPFHGSRPSRMMLGMTLLVAGITLALPYSPLAGLLGFSALPLSYLLVILAIVGLYFLSAETTKRWFYRKYQV